MSHPSGFAWLSGLIASLSVAAWLLHEVIHEVMAVIGNAVEEGPAA